MKKLYFIAGPNGAGKTTASYQILPELWQCQEFVNADEIAKGLSPFNPEDVAIEAGRIQLERINQLLKADTTFSVETTLSTKSYRNLILRAKENGYEVELLYFYLPSAEDAIERVRLRVLSGGHNIPKDVICRRYERGLVNLFQIYLPIVDRWRLVNNIKTPPTTIARKNDDIEVTDNVLFNKLIEHYGK